MTTDQAPQRLQQSSAEFSSIYDEHRDPDNLPERFARHLENSIKDRGDHAKMLVLHPMVTVPSMDNGIAVIRDDQLFEMIGGLQEIEKKQWRIEELEEEMAKANEAHAIEAADLRLKVEQLEADATAGEMGGLSLLCLRTRKAHDFSINADGTVRKRCKNCSVERSLVDEIVARLKGDEPEPAA